MILKDITQYIIEHQHLIREEAKNDLIFSQYLDNRNTHLVDITDIVYKLYQQENNKALIFHAKTKCRLINKSYLYIDVDPTSVGFNVNIRHGSFISRLNKDNNLTYKFTIDQDEKLILYYDTRKHILLYARVDRYYKNQLPILCKNKFLYRSIVSSLAQHIFLIYTNDKAKHIDRFRQVEELIRSYDDTL